jgi:eukaryotic-like serine/threonine-protein kinase
MGEVYRAHDTRLNRDVALKILPSERTLSEMARRRFQREAMAASALNHPNIITIYEIDCVEQIDYIAMEYVRGTTLASLVKRGILSVHQVLRYCTQIADAVGKAHSVGVIHRDLKPGNVMLTDDGLIKVLDFGLAKFNRPLSTEPEESSDTIDAALTLPGTTSGTLAYMSPEQARGDEVGFRSDIFSLGVVMFQLLSGKLPFGGANQMALMHNLHFNPPKDLLELRSDVPESLADLIAHMLEKEPEKRIQTMAEVANCLRGIAREQELSLSQEPGLEATGTFVPPRRAARKRTQRRWLAGVGLVILVAAGLGGWRYFQKKGSASSAAKAQQELPVEDNSYALYKRAREYLDHYDRKGHVDGAIQLLGRAVQLDPSSAASYAALSEAYYQKNRRNPDPQWMKLASEAAKKAVSLDNYLASSHVSLGMVKLESGDSANAEKEFRTAADLDPKSAAPHRWLAVLNQKIGNSDKTADEFRRAITLEPQDWRGYMGLGANAYAAARYQDAATDFEKAQQLDPESISVLQNLAAVYHLLERDDDAAAALQRALAIEPSADIYNNLGTIRFYQGHYDESVPAFEKTVALGANNFDNWANLGDAYRWSSGHKDQAKTAYGHAIQLVREEIAKNPKQVDLHADLAMYLAKSGDKDAALRELKLIEQAGKKEPNTLYLSAVVYELCGQREQALAALATAVQAGQSLADIKNEPEFVSLRADPRYHLRILSVQSSAQ